MLVYIHCCVEGNTERIINKLINLYALRRFILQILGPVAIYPLSNLITKDYPRVIMFHRFSEHPENGKVSAATLEEQLCELKRHFNVVSISDYIERKEQLHSQKKNIIMLTVDDGYADFYQYAFPLFKKYDIPVTVYITTDFISKKIWLWPDKIHYILEKTGKLVSDLTFIDRRFNVPLNSEAERNDAFNLYNEHCLQLTTTERNSFLQQLSRSLEVEIPSAPTLEYASMNWGEVKELAKNNIEIGAHTCTHPIMSKLTHDELHKEITCSKATIEDALGYPIRSFCYPNGTHTDYNETVKLGVKEAGFTHAVAAFHDALGWQDSFEIRRHGVGENMYGFRKVIHGIEYLSDRLKQ